MYIFKCEACGSLFIMSMDICLKEWTEWKCPYCERKMKKVKELEGK
jgi:predicted RNA-binding Zn-ribbon protein involved in translation (DUF1610 family)